MQSLLNYQSIANLMSIQVVIELYIAVGELDVVAAGGSNDLSGARTSAIMFD